MITRMQSKPDILLVVLDTLRADRLSCYGHPRDTTPQMDAFAEGGVIFERAVSPGQWTIPAHASLFTGEYPTTHRMTQIYDKQSVSQITLAQALQREGYLTVGFCNNPLLGVVENGLDRGFDAFYNYGGTVPERPPIADSRPRRAGRLAQRVSRVLRRLVLPVQDMFARNNLLLRLALHPLVVPLWQPHVNFKGNTGLSIRDLVGYLRTRRKKPARRPLFAFVNLMETHLPFRPRPRFIRKFLPYYKDEREARDFMRSYNHEHYRWMIPLSAPLTELQDRVLNDMYDAEVAYEDHLLRSLFRYLRDPEVRDNTLVIITSDHGEGMNHHGFVGHSLVAYDDLVRVPLIVRYPPLYPQGKRVSTPVSTRRIFHTVLESAGIHPPSNSAKEGEGAPVDVEGLSLAWTARNPSLDRDVAYTEAYTPDTLLALMENGDKAAIETYRCRLMRRAIYQGNYKLITVGDEPDELFDVVKDPGEVCNLIQQQPDLAAEMDLLLNSLVAEAGMRHPGSWEAAKLHLEEDKLLAERLRGLGYLD